MSIQLAGLNNGLKAAAHESYSISPKTGGTFNDKYDNVHKYIVKDKARRDFFQESVKLSNIQLNKRLKVQSEAVSNYKRIERNGLNSPKPNLRSTVTASKSFAYAHMQKAVKRAEVYLDKFPPLERYVDKYI